MGASASRLFRPEEGQHLCFVTSNDGKANSANTTLMEFGFPVARLSRKITEPYHTESPKDIVTKKIRNALRLQNVQIVCMDGREIAVSRLSDIPIICEDGGFFVNALNGRPGVQINPYLREGGVERLIREMDSKECRSAYFWEVLAYKYPFMKGPEYFESRVEGTVLSEKRGKLQEFSWSELHLVFVPNGYTKTWAEMSADEYRRYDLRQNSRWNRLGEFLLRRKETLGLESTA